MFNIFHISQASHRLQSFSWLSPFPSLSAVSSKWSRWEFYLDENLLGQAAENQVEFYLDKNQVELYLDKNQVEFYLDKNQVEFYLDKNQVEFYLAKNQVEFLSR